MPSIPNCRSAAWAKRILILGWLICGADSAAAADPVAAPIAQAPQRPRSSGTSAAKVYKDRIAANWFAENSRFWYRNDLRGGGKEFTLVHANRGSREVAFDHRKLAAALSTAAGAEFHGDRLPFDAIEFVADGLAIQFRAAEATWQCNLASYECTKVEVETKPREPQGGNRPKGQGPRRRGPGGRGPERSPTSPDGKWTTVIQNHNVVVRAAGGGDEAPLTLDGREGFAYDLLQWSPDSQTLVAFRSEPGDRKEVHLIQSSPPGGGRAVAQSRPYDLPGDKFAAHELHLFRLAPPATPGAANVATWKETKPTVDRIDFGTPRLRWKSDGRSFTYTKTDRGHQRFRLVEVEAETGRARDIIDEKSETFIWTAHTETVRLEKVNWLERTDEIIFVSERDGWRHLYLIDGRDDAPRADEFAAVRNQITTGNWVVRGIDRIDEENRQVLFRASGVYADQDPYLIHLGRINFDGTGLVWLTEGNGDHAIQFSPDEKYVIDTYSRVDLAPVHELRRVADGKFVCELEQADTSELTESGWSPPEVFVAKGRDGTTDIWGIICRPRDFDASKKYPIIEDIYAGPQSSFVPKSFSSQRRFASLTDLGFVVVKIDGMGTANRSKAFHDVCWHNLKDAGLPDRVLWHQAAAKKFSWYDTGRVGIYGGSAGGQNAAGAVLFQPDFYKVAVAACGCHDNRMDKASWNEQWMGYPVGPQYAESSNIENAQRLRGKLLLIVGEMDTNVPPESTLRFADALIKAGKDFDLLVIPGAGHGMGGAYGQRRMHDFFVRHLLGGEPPDRNAATGRRSD